MAQGPTLCGGRPEAADPPPSPFGDQGHMNTISLACEVGWGSLCKHLTNVRNAKDRVRSR